MQGRTSSTSVYSKNTDVTITENGIYVPPEDYTGFSVVTVDTPTAEDIIMQEDYYILPSKEDTRDPSKVQYDEYHKPYVDTSGKEFQGVENLKVRRIGSWIDSEINADNIKVGHAILGVTGNVVEVHNQANKTTKSSGSTIKITPDSGYTGLSQVTVEPIQVQTKSITLNQTKSTSYPMTATVYSDSGYDGMTRVSVTVNAPPPCPVYVTTDLQIRPKIEQQIFNPSDYDANGFGKITVEPVTSAIDSNIQPPNIAPGVTILGVTGTYKPQNLQDKVVEPNAVQDQIVTADSDYEALGEVTVKKVTSAIDSDIQAGNIREGVDILGVTGTYHGPDYNIETIEGVIPKTTSQSITPSEGYDYIDKVTIEGVTKDIDPNIVAENIRKDVNILGVTGTMETQSIRTQDSKTVSPTTSEQHIFADTGYDAIVELVVRAVSAGIDPNIIAENIKKNITILGVRGTLDAEQKWFDFDDADGIVVLTSDTFGNGQFAPELEAEATDYIITSCIIDVTGGPVKDLSAGLLTTIYGYENLEATDPITYQTYVLFSGGYFYTDYGVYNTIPNQTSYLYPVVNDDNINGCLLNSVDTGFEKTYNVYVLIGDLEAKPVLVDGTMSSSLLPTGYNEYRHVCSITVPAHDVFKPIEAQTANVSGTTQKTPYIVPKLTANGTMGGNSFAVSSSTYLDTNRMAWRAFDGTNTDGEVDCWHSASGLPQWLAWYFPQITYVDTITIANRQSSSYPAQAPKNYQIQTSTDGVNWTTIYTGTNSVFGTSATWSINLTNVQNRSSKYWRMYITSSGENEYAIIGEMTLDAYTITNISNTKWVQPVLTSAWSYGAVTSGPLASTSDPNWKVYGSTITYDLTEYSYITDPNDQEALIVRQYLGENTDITLEDINMTLANVVPELTGSYIQWQLPTSMNLSFVKGLSTITIKHGTSTEVMSGTPMQFFTNNSKTKAITDKFGDSTQEITIPVTQDCITNVLYLYIGEHENYGSIGEIHFNNVYRANTTSISTTQSWLLDNTAKPAMSGSVLYPENSELELLKSNITTLTRQIDASPLKIDVSAFDADMNKPNILNIKTLTKTNVTSVGGLSVVNGIVSGFSSSAYASTTQTLKNNLEITLRAYISYNSSYAQYLISDSVGSGFGVADGSSRYYRICNIDKTTNSGSSAYDNGYYHWIKFKQTGTTSTVYAFRDTGTYTSVDSLPAYTDSVWVQKVSITGQIFKGNTFIIGSRQNGNTSYQGYWRNQIDFANLKLTYGNNMTWKPYGTETHYISNHNVIARTTNLWFVTPEDASSAYVNQAKLFGYMDNGNAVTLNVYGVYDSYNGVKTYVFAPNDDTPLTGIGIPADRYIKLGFAGTVDIPEHIAYRFDQNTWRWIPKN